MSMQFRSSKIEPDIIVVQLIGNVTLMPENQISDPFINDLLEGPDKKLVFDLSGVEHMDSSGVQLMVQCSAAVRKAGGELRLAAANARVARLFQITRLDSVLPLDPTVEAACAAFAGTPD